MIIGFTGHQSRAGLHWPFVREALDHALSCFPFPFEGISSLAAGADQLFAELVLARGNAHRAIIPIPDYRNEFHGDALIKFDALLTLSKVEWLDAKSTAERSYFNAGRRIVELSDRMIAVWDGKPSVGFGGTADIVAHALSKRVPVFQIDPIRRLLFQLPPTTDGAHPHLPPRTAEQPYSQR